MKKSCICLLAVLALLLSLVPSVALAAKKDIPSLTAQRGSAAAPDSTSHEHRFGYHEGQKPYLECYKSNGGVSHSLYKYYAGICIHCAKEGNVAAIGAPENHVFEYSGINQHVKGENRHQYFYVCSTCGEVVFDTFLCRGTGNGDCMIMLPGMLLGVAEEVE